MKNLMLALLATSLLWSGSSGAQTKPTFIVVSEKSNSNAVQCGIVDSSLVSIATLTLRNNGISVSGDATTLLSIQPTVLINSEGCIVSLAVTITAAIVPHELASVLRTQSFKPRDPLSVGVGLCNEGSLLSGPAHNMSQRAHATLENLIKLCLGQLIY